MNIFRTLEAYKRIPKLPASNNPLRVVRGVWVSGEHRDPLTMDALLQIKAVGSHPCEVRRYTETSTNFYNDEVIKYIGIYASDHLDIVDYYETSTNVYDETIKYFGIYSQPLEITDYTQVSTNFYDETIKYTGLYDESLAYYEMTLPKYTKTNPQSAIHILNVTSTPLEYRQ